MPNQEFSRFTASTTPYFSLLDNYREQIQLALATWDAAGEPCCIVLMKADRLAGMVRDLLGPVLKEI